MLKTKVGKITTVAVGLLVAVLILIYASRMHFPFRHPQETLNAHLEQDFGKTLPASAQVEESYWVGFRDSEAVFKLRMAPLEAADFAEKLRGIALTKGPWRTTDLEPRTCRPYFEPASWWNNPRLPDGQAVDIIISDGTAVRCHYLLLYSPGTGTMYVVRGGGR
jgi:hypothetical protein